MRTNLILIGLIAFCATGQCEDREFGNCSAIVGGSSLTVIGNEFANIIDIAGSEREVQVICDGAGERFTGIDQITVEAGDGDDTVSIDESDGLGALGIRIFGQNGNDWTKSQELRTGKVALRDHEFDGGLGVDTFLIASEELAERFDIAQGTDANSVEVPVMDIASGTKIANLKGSQLEILNVKMGDGNDQAHVTQILGMAINILGEEGDDGVTLTEILIEIFPPGPTLSVVDLGGGLDLCVIGGIPLSENYKIEALLDHEVPDPEIQIIDPITGNLFNILHVQHTEQIAINCDDGDDSVAVNWIAARMSGLTLLDVNLGAGENILSAVLGPPPDDGVPVPREVQIASLKVTGGGDDQITFNHSAGSWFDVAFDADTGKGDDAVSVFLGPPPDDSLPGPDGIRQLQYNVVAGKGDDFVRLQNQTQGEFFDVFFTAHFNNGDDLFEGIGPIRDAILLPGRGFDTARVTPNFRPFVSEFEKIEIQE